jgi:hypothetical protein
MKDQFGVWTEDQLQLLLGTGLGDGYIQSAAGSTAAVYMSNHGWCQNEYNCHKYDLMKQWTKQPPRKSVNHGYGEYLSRWSTRTIPELYPIYKLQYPDGKKTVTLDWLSLIDERGLMWWICDDGSFDGRSYTISTHGFTSPEVDLMCMWLGDRFGITAYRIMVTRASTGACYPIIYVPVESSYTLCAVIEPFIPECMRYKAEWRDQLCVICGTELKGLTNGKTCPGACREEYHQVRRQEYYQEHEEEIKEKQREYRKAHMEQHNAMNRASYLRNIERSRARSRKNAAVWLAKHRDEVNARRRERRAELRDDPEYAARLARERASYYERLKQDPERMAERLRKANEYRKTRRAKGSTSEQEYTKEWRKSNPDKVREQQDRANARRRERNRDPEYRKSQNELRRARYEAKRALQVSDWKNVKSATSEKVTLS